MKNVAAERACQNYWKIIVVGAVDVVGVVGVVTVVGVVGVVAVVGVVTVVGVVAVVIVVCVVGVGKKCKNKFDYLSNEMPHIKLRLPLNVQTDSIR